MKKSKTMALSCFLILALAAWARDGESIWPGGRGPYIGADFLVGTPSSTKDLFRSAFPGFSLRYVATERLEFSLDYAFLGFDYYYPASPSGPWRGPVPWSSVPDSFDGMRLSWIFFQTRHFLAPQAWYLASLGELGLPVSLRVGAGPALSFVVPNEAANYYPGLSEAFDQFKASFQVWVGLSIHLGLEFHPLPFTRIGIEYLFVVDSVSEVARNIGADAGAWIGRSGNLVLYSGIRL